MGENSTRCFGKKLHKMQSERNALEIGILFQFPIQIVEIVLDFHNLKVRLSNYIASEFSFDETAQLPDR